MQAGVPHWYVPQQVFLYQPPNQPGACLTCPPRELEAEAESGQKLDSETGLLWSQPSPAEKAVHKASCVRTELLRGQRSSLVWAEARSWEERCCREVFACGTRHSLVLSHSWEGPEPEDGGAGLLQRSSDWLFSLGGTSCCPVPGHTGAGAHTRHHARL